MKVIIAAKTVGVKRSRIFFLRHGWCFRAGERKTWIRAENFFRERRENSGPRNLERKAPVGLLAIAENRHTVRFAHAIAPSRPPAGPAPRAYGTGRPGAWIQGEERRREDAESGVMVRRRDVRSGQGKGAWGGIDPTPVAPLMGHQHWSYALPGFFHEPETPPRSQQVR